MLLFQMNRLFGHAKTDLPPRKGSFGLRPPGVSLGIGIALTVSSLVSHDAVIRFGVFEADLRSGELRKRGAKVKIQELPFQALKLLLKHSNEVVNRDQLRQALWSGDVYVDFDRGVISAINRLRDALGDTAENPVFIETVGRRGYRWIGPIHSETLEAVVPDRASAEPGSRDFTARD